MCQQTRVEAVIPYWLTWMEAFPTVEALAAASEDEVNAKWAGLGFYRRRMLHEGAAGGGVARRRAAARRRRPALDQGHRAVHRRRRRVDRRRRRGAGGRRQCPPRCVAAVRGGGDRQGPLLCARSEASRGRSRALVGAAAAPARRAEPTLMEVGATYCAPAGGVDGADPLAPSIAEARPRGVRGARAGDLEALLYGATGVRGAAARRARAPTPSSTAARGGRGANGGGGGDDGAPAAAAAAGEENGARSGTRWPPCTPRTRWRGAGCWRSGRRRGTGGAVGVPHAVVASDAATVPDDPGSGPRSYALENMLMEAAGLSHAVSNAVGAIDAKGYSAGAVEAPRQSLAEPLEHIFSHVRHTMHVEYGSVLSAPDEEEVAAWKAKAKGKGKGAASSAPREFRWMAEGQMKEVGVTAGVLKVIAAVRPPRTAAAEDTTKGKKRARRPPPASAQKDPELRHARRAAADRHLPSPVASVPQTGLHLPSTARDTPAQRRETSRSAASTSSVTSRGDIRTFSCGSSPPAWSDLA